MVKPYRLPNISDKGLYTTMIPLESMSEYEYECNHSEVNVIVTEKLLTGLPGGSKIECINVVKSEPFSFHDD